ncbi:hypothetical protein MU582_02725 [Nocardioidaceae bacterium SCSIO 66511]|nr:hypothetical protein MU582_02725 [Nocardioidaceae bacterium SCSIO 66511]
MSTLLQQPVLVVERKEVCSDHAIVDREGNSIGHVRRVEQSAARKAFRLVSKIDEYLSHQFEVVDQDGDVTLRLDQPARFVRAQLVVSDATDREVGEVTQLNSVGKIRFGLTSGGTPVGELRTRNAKQHAFDILDVKERPIGSVQGTYPRGTSASTVGCAITLQPDVEGPLRTLAIAAGIGLDLSLQRQEPSGSDPCRSASPTR